MLRSKNEISNNYKRVFKTRPKAIYYSPGRVNLIGEHIDYHGGLVLPAALSIGTYGAISLREDDIIRVYSEGYGETTVDFTLKDLAPSKEIPWINYIKGVLKILQLNDYSVKSGFNLYIETTMPTSGGLSSSASLELLVLKMLSDLNNFNIKRTKMALLGKQVENEYLGLLSGIMDQFVIAHGKIDNALLLNTGTLEFDYIPLDLKEYALVIVNTNKKRGLTDSKYNERYSETMAALALLQKTFNINFLAELTAKDLPKIKTLLDPLAYRRVRHVITEQARTKESGELLKSGDILSFAKNLTASHQSLRDDYEVTGIELDTLVELLHEAGAVGARMTGAGFGGCAIALVTTEQVKALTTYVSHEYSQKIGYTPSFFTTTIENGTRRL